MKFKILFNLNIHLVPVQKIDIQILWFFPTTVECKNEQKRTNQSAGTASLAEICFGLYYNEVEIDQVLGDAFKFGYSFFELYVPKNSFT